MKRSPEGIVCSYIDDLFWAATPNKMVNVIDFVRKNGSDYGYRLNVDKLIYLMVFHK